MTARSPRPIIENAPGITWRKWRKNGWEARWRPRADLVDRGYPKTPVRLWAGSVLTDLDRDSLAARCGKLQDDMLMWGRRGLPVVTAFDGTLASLIRCYLNDKDSPYHKVRYRTRFNYERSLRRVTARHGEVKLATIKARMLLGWHAEWGVDGHVSMAHSFIAKLRILMNFGATFLEDEECERLSAVLHRMRFPMSKPREEWLTAEQVIAVRAEAHKRGRPSIALAQAFQFELMLRQTDVIGEWVPISEPGLSKTIYGQEKWLRGIEWSEIDANLIMKHVTSKRQKAIEPDLKMAPMIMEELAKISAIRELPASGPVVVNERTERPYRGVTFRNLWRDIANACGIPKTVRNMDSRAGAITEATDAGAPIEHVRHAATHSNINMTERYSRGGSKKAANVMRFRTEHRNKPGTE